MSYDYPPEMTPWREPQGPASDGRLRAMAKQWRRVGTGEGGIIRPQIVVLPSPDRLRLQEAVQALGGPVLKEDPRVLKSRDRLSSILGGLRGVELVPYTPGVSPEGAVDLDSIVWSTKHLGRSDMGPTG